LTTDDAIARCVYAVLMECDVKAKSTRLLVMQMLSNTSRTATDIAPYLPNARVLMDMQDEWIAQREWMRHQPDPLAPVKITPSMDAGLKNAVVRFTSDVDSIMAFDLRRGSMRPAHVLTDKDGNQALCGGPGLCEVCDRERQLVKVEGADNWRHL